MSQTAIDRSELWRLHLLRSAIRCPFFHYLKNQYHKFLGFLEYLDAYQAAVASLRLEATGAYGRTAALPSSRFRAGPEDGEVMYGISLIVN